MLLTRLDERRYETLITRSNGVQYPVKGVGHMAAIPHDLAHFAIEQGWESAAASGEAWRMGRFSGV